MRCNAAGRDSTSEIETILCAKLSFRRKKKKNDRTRVFYESNHYYPRVSCARCSFEIRIIVFIGSVFITTTQRGNCRFWLLLSRFQESVVPFLAFPFSLFRCTITERTNVRRCETRRDSLINIRIHARIHAPTHVRTHARIIRLIIVFERVYHRSI